MAKGKIVSGSTIDVYLTILRGLSEELREAESTVDELRDRKWDCVKLLKDLGHDFTASSEGQRIHRVGWETLRDTSEDSHCNNC